MDGGQQLAEGLMGCSWSPGLSWPTRLCMDMETVPVKWQIAVEVPIFHKGDQRERSKNRGSHSSLPGKVYAWVLDRSVPLLFKPQIEEEQHRFLVWMGCNVGPFNP